MKTKKVEIKNIATKRLKEFIGYMLKEEFNPQNLTLEVAFGKLGKNMDAEGMFESIWSGLEEYNKGYVNGLLALADRFNIEMECKDIIKATFSDFKGQ